MQLYAHDESGSLVSCEQAVKHKDYFCLECTSIVHCRGGFIRHMHFYHVEPNRACRQNGKSLTHLQVQHQLKQILPHCLLEKPFPVINRIADVFWEPEKLVFEIQCSSITAREIEQRNKDYRSIGCRTIWILHDRHYNQTQLTAAEYYLQNSPHYFTSIDEEGQGMIYDQWDLIAKGKRLKTIGFREIKIDSYFLQKQREIELKYPQWVKDRMQQWPLYFSGDYIDYFLSLSEAKKKEWMLRARKEEKISKGEGSIFNLMGKGFSILLFPYRFLLHFLLDRLTR